MAGCVVFNNILLMNILAKECVLGGVTGQKCDTHWHI